MMENLTGRWLAGRYNLQQLLGHGSIGDVYKAWDRQRALHLSLKLLNLDLANDRLFLSNFQRDQQTLIQLQHTYIVGFYGLEQAEGLAFLLQDYIDGSNLAVELPRIKSPLSVTQAMFILRPVCAGLHYVHQMGVAHGDLKPANILLHRRGTVLASDVGIKRLVELSASSSVHILRTPVYMAPEQIRGKPPTPQSDIYALGIILFEMLTGGKRPFEGEHAKAGNSLNERISWEQLNLAPPSLRRLNSSVPANVEAALMCCLNKQPEKRFDKAMELLDALEGDDPSAAGGPPAFESSAQTPPVLKPATTGRLSQTGSLVPRTGALKPPASPKPASPPTLPEPPASVEPIHPPVQPASIAPEQPAVPATPAPFILHPPDQTPASVGPFVPAWLPQPPSISRPPVVEKPTLPPTASQPPVPRWTVQPPFISEALTPDPHSSLIPSVQADGKPVPTQSVSAHSIGSMVEEEQLRASQTPESSKRPTRSVLIIILAVLIGGATLAVIGGWLWLRFIR